MAIKYTFERYEIKFLITQSQKTELLQLFNTYMKKDDFGPSSMYNIYYDTPDFLLIRRSIEKPVYREKLRLRSYGVASDESPVYLELKKKFKSIVYKRRISLTYPEAQAYFTNQQALPEGQIAQEMDYIRTFYQTIIPKVFIGYDRQAFFAKDDPNVRITLDDNIIWRTDNLDLTTEKYGEEILPPGMSLMEVKVAQGIPLWLTDFLTANKIYKASFSKYGNVYKEIARREQLERRITHVS